jgi:hypothetical protein
MQMAGETASEKTASIRSSIRSYPPISRSLASYALRTGIIHFLLLATRVDCPGGGVRGRGLELLYHQLRGEIHATNFGRIGSFWGLVEAWKGIGCGRLPGVQFDNGFKLSLLPILLVHVLRSPARPCWSSECCQERNSSTVSM